jgi:alkaline phosphatase D
MTIKITRPAFRTLSRRRFLSTAAATGISTIAMPYLSRAADRPAVTQCAIRRRIL